MAQCPKCGARRRKSPTDGLHHCRRCGPVRALNEVIDGQPAWMTSPTGRFASGRPPEMHNIRTRTPEGIAIRAALSSANPNNLPLWPTS